MGVKKDNGSVFSFPAKEVTRMSAWQPIDINPLHTTNGVNAVTNGIHNSNYKTLRDAYDDSPTHASIINSMVNYMYADGLANVDTISGLDISKYLDEDTIEKICIDMVLFGGFDLQPIWNDSEKDRKILKFEYVPIDKMAVEVDRTSINPKVNGYWYSWDWEKLGQYPPVYCKKFNGTYQGGIEIFVCQRVTKNNFFPLPYYFSGINYCISEGYLGQNTKNHFFKKLMDPRLRGDDKMGRILLFPLQLSREGFRQKLLPPQPLPFFFLPVLKCSCLAVRIYLHLLTQEALSLTLESLLLVLVPQHLAAHKP